MFAFAGARRSADTDVMQGCAGFYTHAVMPPLSHALPSCLAEVFTLPSVFLVTDVTLQTELSCFTKMSELKVHFLDLFQSLQPRQDFKQLEEASINNSAAEPHTDLCPTCTVNLG